MFKIKCKTPYRTNSEDSKWIPERPQLKYFNQRNKHYYFCKKKLFYLKI